MAFDDVNNVFIAVASLTDGYPATATLSQQTRRISLPYKVCSIFGELWLLKSGFLKSLTEAYVLKIFTHWCLFHLLAPHRASIFFHVLRSFILSFHMPGVCKECSNGGQQDRQRACSRNFYLRDLQMPEHNHLGSLNLFCCRLNIKQFL